MSANVEIRRDYRSGDLEAILDAHARIYPSEYGVDSQFVAMVADSIARAQDRGFPTRREGMWILECDRRHAGSVALTDEDGGIAMLRWVLLDEALRGQGWGRRLIGEAIEFARRQRFERVRLDTFSLLTQAAAIYRGFGFEVIGADTGPRWGLPEITYQHYELRLERVRPPEQGLKLSATH